MTGSPPFPTDPSASALPTGEGAASFGFREVRAADKAPLVRQVFDSVADRYDLMNDLMSAGVHRLWKAALVDWLAPRPGLCVLDVAGGTGDIGRRILARQPSASIILADINARMLSVGRDRNLDQGLVPGRTPDGDDGKGPLPAGITHVCADAEALPLPDRSVDAYTIAFGLRNVTRIDAALAEAFRVLKPGGRFLCLEFSRVVLPGLDRLYDRYSFSLLPQLGQWVAGDGPAYRYLVESIRRFPDQDSLVDRMAAAGFARAAYRNFSGGIAALHSGWRL